MPAQASSVCTKKKQTNGKRQHSCSTECQGSWAWGTDGYRGADRGTFGLCRVPSSLRPLFGPAAEADRDALYSEVQVQQALLDYQSQQQLTAPGQCIKLDRCLPLLLIMETFTR